MRIRKLFKNKYAFSAIVASLILMLLAVAAGVVVYAYVMGWIGGAQQNPTQTGKIQFDSIVANTTTVSLYVRNVGGVDLTLSAFYVEGLSVANKTALTASLPVQTTAFLAFEPVGGMTVANFYEVKVVCTDGTTVSTSVQAGA